MKKVVIIGGSAAGMRAAEEIRKKDPQSEVTVFCEEAYPPSRRDAFPKFLAKELEETDLFYRPLKFYQDQGITLVQDKKVIKVNLNRRYVTTEDKAKTDFDVLILTDTAETRWPDIKGVNKTGIFTARKAEDIKNIDKQLIFVETAAVVTDSIQGIELACALKKRGKETLLLFPGESLLSGFLDADAVALLIRELEEQDIRVFTNIRIDEILGDSDVKALRLSSGKVLGCDMIIFPDAAPSLKKFLDTDLEIDRGICVDQNFRSNIENVFAIDGVCQIRQARQKDALNPGIPLLEEYGRILAGSVCGETQESVSIVPIQELSVGSLSLKFLGMKPQENVIPHLVKKDLDNKIYQCVFTSEGLVQAAVLMNCDDGQYAEILNLVTERSAFQAAEPSLSAGQEPQQFQ